VLGRQLQADQERGAKGRDLRQRLAAWAEGQHD